jgi:cysteine-rich repeat protein
VCGNGIRCGAEQCDDGNTSSGDCCSAACTYEAASAPCDDHDLCTILDVCNGSGTCAGTAAPEPVCRQPTQPGKSSVLLKDKTPDDGDQVSWRWNKGAQTDPLALGDPLSTTSYALCVYDQSARPQPLLRITVPPVGMCNGKDCWAATHSGFRYRNTTGLRSLKLKAGDPGKAQISLRGKGAALGLPMLGLTTPVTVQVKNSAGQCWGATFSNPTANAADQFKAKSD